MRYLKEFVPPRQKSATHLAVWAKYGYQWPDDKRGIEISRAGLKCCRRGGTVLHEIPSRDKRCKFYIPNMSKKFGLLKFLVV